MKEFYESLGLEVLVTSATPEEGQECSGCFDMPEFEDRYKTIYTRGKADPEKERGFVRLRFADCFINPDRHPVAGTVLR